MERSVLQAPGSDLVDAFHNDRHHIVKLQAFAAKGLLLDNARAMASSIPSSSRFFFVPPVHSSSLSLLGLHQLLFQQSSFMANQYSQWHHTAGEIFPEQWSGHALELL